MRIAFVGCGFVFDIYMRTKWAHPELEVCGVFDINTARSQTVGEHYGFHVYPSLEALLSDPRVEIVVNLTSIRSHYDISKRALLANKHVYSEKPLTTELEQTRELFAIAARQGVVFTGAPCNLFCDAVSTLWKAVRDGAIGKPLLVYAEVDDNPIHLMNVENVRSPTGAPWPYVEEFQEGCTAEHIGYHLIWICAMFGPVISVTAYSKSLVPHKTKTPLSPPDTPDFSVACLDFEAGVSARITCSMIAPRDHRLRIVGEEGELCADSYDHDRSPVHLERFSSVSLTARKLRTLRTRPRWGSVFGIGGRKLPLIHRWKSFAVETERGTSRTLKQRFVGWLRRREVNAQDKFLGIAEMARAIREQRPQPLPPDFLMHLNEITYLVQRAGPKGVATVPQTSFRPLSPLPDVANYPHDYRHSYRMRLLEKLLGSAMNTFHRS